MLNILLASVLAMVSTVPTQAPVTHICWVDRVEAEGSGVRVFFAEGAPVHPDEESVHGELGATFSPANSGHDGCRLTVARKGKKLGVQAEAHFFALYITPEPEIRREWIAADPAP